MRRGGDGGGDKVWEVRFLRSPVEILSSGDSGSGRSQTGDQQTQGDSRAVVVHSCYVKLSL